VRQVIALMVFGVLIIGLNSPAPNDVESLRPMDEGIRGLVDSTTQELSIALGSLVKTRIAQEIDQEADQEVSEILPVIESVQEFETNVDNPDDMTLERAPSLNPYEINGILADYGSPAAETGQVFYDMGLKYNIDPAYAVSFFIHESSAGTAGGWAGLKPDGSTTHNIGNIVCAGYPTCYGRFRDYGSWEEGIEDWYRLIRVEYIEGRGHRTVADVIPVYAPAFENNVNGYNSAVEAMVAGWRRIKAPVKAEDAPTNGRHPLIDPLPPTSAVFTSVNCDYWSMMPGCQHLGTDYPAPVGTPVHLPEDCAFISKADTSQWGGGYFICNLVSSGGELYLGHIQNVQGFATGETVPAGTVIGEVYPHPNGSHLHVQLKMNGQLTDWESY
jgi:murein DD-endopeptidase MepM/ murein hydrolase activator NlpD